MSDAARALDPSFPGSLDVAHALDLIRSAIAMLASGAATRITLVGLPIGDETLREVDALIRARGMVMRAMRTDVGCDITVEASG